MEFEKESLELQFIGRELNATIGANGPKNGALYNRLIAEAKNVKNIPGALYLATEAMPFDSLSGNFKRTPYNNQSKAFAATATSPYFKPILYSHEDGTGFFGGTRPNIVGRVLSQAIADNGRGGKSIFTGQVITDKEAIERVNSFIDYSQSISFYPQGYTCDVCGEDPMKGCGMDESANRCFNLGKEITVEKSKKKTRVTWSVIPNYIAEISFVAIPAYQDAMVLSMEQNSLGQGLVMPRMGGLESYYQYQKKDGLITVGDIPTGKEQNNSDKGTTEQSSGTIGSESNQEQNDMELKEQLEAFKKEVSETLAGFEKRFTELADKVSNGQTEASAKAEAEKKAKEEAEKNAQAASGQADLNKALEGITVLVEQNKKLTENYSALEGKIEQFLKNQAPAKEAEIEAEKNAAAAAEAEKKAAEEKAAADAAAAAKIEAEKNAAKKKIPAKGGRLAGSIIKR